MPKNILPDILIGQKKHQDFIWNSNFAIQLASALQRDTGLPGKLAEPKLSRSKQRGQARVLRIRIHRTCPTISGPTYIRTP